MPGVSDYAAVHARARAMYAAKLTPEVRSRLEEAADLKALIDLLKDTAYGPFLSAVEDENLTSRRAVFQMQERTAGIYTAIIHGAPGSASRRLLLQSYRHFEVDNLKAILRGVETGAAWDRIRFVLFPFGLSSVLPEETMAQAADIRSAVERLRGTPYYETLDHAMARYNAERSLFPLEVALDLQYWRTLWDNVHQLPDPDRAPCVRLIGSWMDATNLMWAVRYRVFYGLSEEEVVNYTLPFGYRIRDEDLRSIAAGGDIARIVEGVYPGLPDLHALLEEPRRGLVALGVRLRRHLAEQCRAVLCGYPFHIGLPLAVAMLSEMEVQDLTVLVEAKVLRMPPEKFRPYLVTDEGPRAEVLQ
jgi:V/A-type H+-transporting ATPase subunit C